MTTLSRIFISFIFCLIVAKGHGQQAAAVDSMKRALARATSTEQKIYWLDLLSRTVMNVDLKKADEYGQQLIMVAEESRNREWMINAYLSNGTRCSYLAGSRDYTNRSIDYYNKALAIARQNRLDKYIGSAYLKLAAIHLAIPEKDKALSYANQGSSIISSLNGEDSLKAEAHNTYGHVYLSRNDKTLALRHYLNALRTAEEIKNPPNPSLVRSCYLYLSAFYSGIGDYDKAIDYHVEAHKKLDEIKDSNVPYMRTIDLNSIGKLHASKKNDEIAIDYFRRSLAMADSLKFSTLKMPAYTSLLNQYLRLEPRKALDYFNSEEGKNLQKFLYDFGFGGAVDQAYGAIYMEIGQLDSAKTYYEKARNYFESSRNEQQKLPYYAERAAKNLDSLYVRTGNYQMANVYNSIYYQYKDSLEKMNKEKELAQIEATDEQIRQERIAREQEEKKRRKNNIQYLGITIGIAAFFIALVVLGMFKVSASTIKMIGFFAFIMFFEFIFLIFKKNIYAITHGEPWKDLLFMIGLAALLLPLHHWLEEKVIHYLTSHNRLTSAGTHLKKRLFRRAKTGEE
jgi:tetratricopeptide (TPR) repeat protein